MSDNPTCAECGCPRDGHPLIVNDQRDEWMHRACFIELVWQMKELFFDKTDALDIQCDLTDLTP
jgi:hypothetical protein